MKQNKVNYEREVMKKRRENVKEVRRNICSPNMIEKIRNYAMRHDLNKNYVEQKIIDDPNFARQFAKDPLKQSIHEKIAAKHIEEIPCVDYFRNLPSAGKGAKYVGPTGITTGENFGKSKSIDFEIRKKDKRVYATHKYTGSEGGAQDNQFNDVKQFISDVVQMRQSGNVSDNVSFVAILDGPYYQRHGRVKELERSAVGCVSILSINEVEDFLEKL